MKKLVLIFLLLPFLSANSQYYYKDIRNAADITLMMKNYTSNNIRKVTATGIAPEGRASTDFSETQEINAIGNELRITTRANRSISSLVHKFNEKGWLVITIDSNVNIISTSNYNYDPAGNIISISNNISDADSTQDFSQTEVHQYIYKDGKLDKMWRIINKTDSLEVRFVTDENGNIIEERNFRKGKPSDPVYYYYDDRNRLTDIVRFNRKANKLLPDYLFEYDEQDRQIQKITTTTNQNLGYLTWRYIYNDKGLKTKEALFNKEKQLQGRIDYSYNWM